MIPGEYWWTIEDSKIQHVGHWGSCCEISIHLIYNKFEILRWGLLQNNSILSVKKQKLLHCLHNSAQFESHVQQWTFMKFSNLLFSTGIGDKTWFWIFFLFLAHMRLMHFTTRKKDIFFLRSESFCILVSSYYLWRDEEMIPFAGDQI